MSLSACFKASTSPRSAGVIRRKSGIVRCQNDCSNDPIIACRRQTLHFAASLALSSLGLSVQAHAMETSSVDPLRAILRAPADFYRSRQQANGGAKILAPIRASRARLEECLAALEADPSAFEPALVGVRAASLNCYLFEADGRDGLETRASLLQQQISLGDPCTFRILHKNALTLVTDPALEREADRSLDALVRSFQLLDDMLDRARDGDPQAVGVVADLLRQCIQNNVRFEGVIKDCIGVPA